MFKNKIKECNPRQIFKNVNKIKLVDGNFIKISWDQYLREATQCAEGKTSTDFYAATEKEYKNYIRATTIWKSSFSTDDELTVITYDDSTAIISSDWSGHIKLNFDLILELYEEVTFPLNKHVRYYANLLKKAQGFVYAGSQDHLIGGVRPGARDMWVRWGSNEEIVLIEKNKKLMIGNALFNILS